MDAEWIGDETPRPKLEFPPEIAPVFECSRQEVVALNFFWRTYLELYGTPENMDIINRTAPGAFNFLEQALRTEMVMTINRLLDPSVTMGRDNLTLSRLVEIAAPLMTDGSGDVIQKLLAETKEHCKPMKHLRDKTIGHNDLNTKLKFKETPLPGIGRSEVVKSLSMISELMNAVDGYFKQGTTMFGDPSVRGSADHLMFYLKRGLEAPDPDLEKYR